jgi:glycosyltransferase involved in cell wall biosynthesis
MNYKVDILLATYNSKNYLEELLESLLCQTYESWRLLVRDDKSNDNTLDILNDYKQKHPHKITIIESDKNVGVVQSFEKLLEVSNAPYIMFCDHDDVWFDTKIEKTLKKMLESETKNDGIPILVHSDLMIVDENLQTKHESFRKFSRLNNKKILNFNYLAIASAVTGCTIMINRNAKNYCLPFHPNCQMHDWWLALAISKHGKIEYIDEPLLLYRQHAHNQLGANTINDLSSFIRNKITNIRKMILLNKQQFQLLKTFDFGGFHKYLFYKLKYFIITRLN